MRGFFEARMLGQIVDVVSAIGKNSVFTVDITDRRRCGDYIFQTFLEGRLCFRHGVSHPEEDRRYQTMIPQFTAMEAPGYTEPPQPPPTVVNDSWCLGVSYEDTSVIHQQWLPWTAR